MSDRRADLHVVRKSLLLRKERARIRELQEAYLPRPITMVEYCMILFSALRVIQR